MEITGYLNPVKAALAWFDSRDIEVHRGSFERMATMVGNVEIEGGFIVHGYEELGWLCEIGGFVIYSCDGMIAAMTPAEFQMGRTEQ